MLHSFLFESADWFYPSGRPADPAALPALDTGEVRQIQRTATPLLTALKALADTLAPQLDSMEGRAMFSVHTARLTLSDSGQPWAAMQPDGVLTIDVKVLQAVFRTALLAAWRDTSFGFENFNFGNRDLRSFGVRAPRGAEDARTRAAPSEAEVFAAFFAVRDSVRGLEAHGTIGDLFSGENSLSAAIDLAGVSNDVERRYGTTLLFIFAHELGHIALGHFALVKADTTCATARRVELEADSYGLLLMVAATVNAQAVLTELLPLELPEEESLDEKAGFEDFFRLTWDLAGFTGRTGSGCTYPSVDERLAALHSAIEPAAELRQHYIQILARSMVRRGALRVDTTPPRKDRR